MNYGALASAHIFIRDIREQLALLEQISANAAGFKSDEWARVLQAAFYGTSTALDLATREAYVRIREK